MTSVSGVGLKVPTALCGEEKGGTGSESRDEVRE